jgi:hypothetical protein
VHIRHTLAEPVIEAGRGVATSFETLASASPERHLTDQFARLVGRLAEVCQCRFELSIVLSRAVGSRTIGDSHFRLQMRRQRPRRCLREVLWDRPWSQLLLFPLNPAHPLITGFARDDP